MEGVKKRSCDESAVEQPEVKKLRCDIFDTLDDVDVEFGVDLDASELTSVMRSFEDEIELPVDCKKSSSSVAVVEALDNDLSTSEIGWLLEASDDELGLPPSGHMKELLPLSCFKPAEEDGWEVESWEFGCGGELDDVVREDCSGFDDLFGYEDGVSPTLDDSLD